MRDFIYTYKDEVAFAFGIIGIIVGLISNDINIILLRSIFAILAFTSVFLLVRIEKYKKKLKNLDNRIDNVTLEVVNRFKNRKSLNKGFNYNEIYQIARIKEYDVSLEYEYKGICISKYGEDSMYFEIYADSNIAFNEINFEYFDLKHDKKVISPQKATLMEEDNKLFCIRARFNKKLEKGHSFHLKYTCTLKNCINFGDDYLSLQIPKCRDGVESYKFELEFIDQNASAVELFDSTEGGEGKFLQKLVTNCASSPFIYCFTQSKVSTLKNYVVKFHRQI